MVDPFGNPVGAGVVGTAFAAQVGFTIAAGSTAFAVGDSFAITVTALNTWAISVATATDGSQIPQCILAEWADTSAGAAPAAAYFTGDFTFEALTVDASWTFASLSQALSGAKGALDLPARGRPRRVTPTARRAPERNPMLKSTVSKIIERLGLAQSALKAPASALDDLLRARQAAEAAAAEATAEIERLASARSRLLIEAGDEDLAKHDSDAAAAGRTRERAMAMIPPLDEKIAAAEREAEATRRRAIRAEAARKIAAAKPSSPTGRRNCWSCCDHA